MKLTKDQKQTVVLAVKQGLAMVFDELGTGVGFKIKVADCTGAFIKFAMICPNDSTDDTVEQFVEYVESCARSFKNWPEAKYVNWVGYVNKEARMKEFAHKLKTRPVEVAGKKGEDAWAF